MKEDLEKVMQGFVCNTPQQKVEVKKVENTNNIVNIELSKLVAFRKRQPFSMYDEIKKKEVLESIKERHRLETERDIAPFVKAEDAVVVDSTKLSIDEVVEEILKIIDKKLEK